ncbi:MAG TPA: glycosyltransferase family 4 protein [Verrucomicrobiaceae bacterium]
MKIFFHDYPGHAFSMRLSRELANLGHEVVHAFAAALESPRGALQPRPDDPPGLTILPLVTGAKMNKYSVKRILDERKYGHMLARAVRDAAPDLFVTCTTPNDVLDVLRTQLPPQLRILWWLQDIYSTGIKSVINRKLPLAGTVIGAVYRKKEKQFAARADRIISITPDFVPFLSELGVPKNKITVIENWAPVDEIVPLTRENDWKQEQGLSGRKVVLYSGTLGLKHNPMLLSDAAAHYQSLRRDDVCVVVATQGLGAEFLKKEIARRKLNNLKIVPWQPYKRLAEMLSSADILTAIIEPDAGLFSVPSKVLSCLCAGRPVVAAIPSGNLAARTIARAEAGLVVEPTDQKGFLAALDKLLADPPLAKQLGDNGRCYAEKTFDIRAIAERFLAHAA